MADVEIEMLEQQRLIEQLKSMIRERDEAFAKKDHELQEVNSKLSKIKLQTKAKVAKEAKEARESKTAAKKEQKTAQHVQEGKAPENGDPPEPASKAKSLLAKKKLEEKDRIIKEHEEMVVVKDQQIEVKEKIIAEREEIINSMKKQLEDKTALMEQLQTQSTGGGGGDAEAQVTQMYAQIVYKDKNLLELNNKILELERRLIDLQEFIGEKNEVIRGRDKVIQMLQSTFKEKDQNVSDQALLITKLTGKVESNDETLSELQEKLEKAEHDLKQEQERFNLRLTESQRFFEETLKEQDEKVAKLRKVLQDKESELLVSENDLRELISRHEKDIQKFMAKGEVNLQDTVIQMLEQKLKDTNEILDGKIKVIELLQKESSAKEKKLEESREIQRSFKEKLQVVSEQMMLTQASQLDMESMWQEEKRKLNTKIKEIVEKHEHELAEKDVQIQTLKASADQLDTAYTQSMAQYNILQDRYQALVRPGGIAEVQRSSGDGNQSNEELKEQLNAMKAVLKEKEQRFDEIDCLKQKSESIGMILEEKDKEIAKLNQLLEEKEEQNQTSKKGSGEGSSGGAKGDTKMLKVKAQLTAKVKHLEKELAEIKKGGASSSEVSDLKAQLSKLTEERDSLQQKLVETETNLQGKVESQLEVLQADVSKITAEKEKADSELASVREERETLQDEVDQLHNTLKQLKTKQTEEAEENSKELKRKVTEKQEEVDQLQQELSEVRETLTQELAKTELINSEKVAMEIKAVEAEEQIEGLEKAKLDLTEEVKTVRRQMLEDMQQPMIDIEKERNELREKVAEVQQELQQVTGLSKEQKDQINTLTSQLHTVSDEKSNVEEELSNLKASMIELESSKAQQVQVIETLQSDLGSLTEKCQNIEEDFNSASQKAKELETEVLNLRKANDDLHDNANKLSAEIQEKESMAKEHTMTAESLSIEIKQIKEELDNEKVDNERTKNMLAMKEQEICDFLSVIQEHTTNLSGAKEFVVNQIKLVTDLQSETEELTQQYEVKKCAIEKEMQQAVDNLSLTEDNLQNMQEKCSELNEMLTDNDLKVKQLSRENEVLKAGQLAKGEELESRTQNLLEKIADLEKEVASVTTEKEKYANGMESLEKDISEYKQKNDSDIAELKREYAEKVTKLETDLNSETSLRVSVQDRELLIQQELNAVQSQLAESNACVQTLQTAEISLDEECSKKDITITDLKGEKERLDALVDSLSQSLESVQSDLQKSMEEKDSVSSESSALKEEMLGTQSQLTVLKHETIELETKQAEFVKQIESQSETIRLLELKHATLEEEKKEIEQYRDLLNESCTEKDSKIVSFQGQLEQLEKTKTDLECQHQELQSLSADLREQCLSHENQIVQLKTELQDLHTVHGKHLNEVDSEHSQKVGILETEIADLKEQSQKQLQASSQQIEELHQESADLVQKEQKETHSGDVSEAEQRESGATTDKHKVSHQESLMVKQPHSDNDNVTTMLQSQISQLNETVENLCSTKHTLEGIVEETKTQLHKKIEENCTMLQELEVLTDKLSRLEHLHTVSEERLNSVSIHSQELVEKLYSSESQCKKGQMKVDSQKKIIFDLESEINRLRPLSSELQNIEETQFQPEIVEEKVEATFTQEQTMTSDPHLLAIKEPTNERTQKGECLDLHTEPEASLNSSFSSINSDHFDLDIQGVSASSNELLEKLKLVTQERNKFKTDNKKLLKVGKGKEAKLRLMNDNFEKIRAERDDLLVERDMLENKAEDISVSLMKELEESHKVIALEEKCDKLTTLLKQKESEVERLTIEISNLTNSNEIDMVPREVDMLSRENEKLKVQTATFQAIDKGKSAKIRQISQEFEKKLELKEAELNDKQNEVQSHEQTIAVMTTQIEELKTEVTKLSADVIKLQKLNKGKEAKVKKMENLVRDKEKQVSLKDSETTNVQQEVGQLLVQIEDTKDRETNLHQQLEKTIQDKKEVEKKCSEISEKSIKMEELIVLKDDEIKKLLENEAQLKSLKEEKIVLEFELDCAKEELNRVLNNPGSEESVSFEQEEKFNEEEARVDKQEGDEQWDMNQEDMKVKLAKLHSENKKLLQDKNKIQKIGKGKDAKLKKVEEFIAEQQKIISEKDTDIIILQENIKDLSSKVMMLEEEEKDLEFRLETANDDISEWRAHYYSLEDKLEGALEDLDLKSDEIDRLDDEVLSCRDEINSLLNEKDDLERERDYLNSEIDKCKENIQQKNTEIESLSEQLNELRIEKTDITSEIAKLKMVGKGKDAKLKKLETAFNVREANLEENTTLIQSLEEQLTLKCQENETYVLEIQKLQQLLYTEQSSVHQHGEESRVLQETVLAMKAKIEDTENESSQWQQQLVEIKQSLEAEVTALQGFVKEKDDELSQREKSNKSELQQRDYTTEVQHNQITDLSDKLSQAERHVEDLKFNLIEKEKQIELLSQSIEEMTIKQSQIVEEQNANYSNLHYQYQEMEKALTDSRAEASHFAQSVSILEQDISSGKHAHSEDEEVIKSYKEKCQALERQFGSCMEVIQTKDAELAQLRRKCLQSEQTMDEMQTHMSGLQDQLQIALSEKGALEQKLVELNEFSSSSYANISEMENEIRALHNQVHMKDQIIFANEQKLNELEQNEMMELRSSISERDETLKGLYEEQRVLHEKLEQSNDTCQKYKSKVESLQQETLEAEENLKSTLTLLQQELKNMKDENDDLTKRYNLTLHQNSEYGEIFKQKDEELHSLKQLMKDKFVELENVKKTNEMLQHSGDGLASEKERFEELLRNEREEIQSLYDQMNQLVSEKLDLECSVEQKDRDLRLAAEELRKFANDRDNMDEVIEKKEELEVEVQTMNRDIGLLRSRLQDNEKEKKDFKLFLSEKDFELGRLNQNVESLNNVKLELENEIRTLRETADQEEETNQALHKELDSKREACNKLQGMCTEKEQLLSSLKETISELSNQNSEYKTKCSNLNEEIALYKQQLDSLTNLADIETEKNQYVNMCSELENEVENLKQSLKSISNDHDIALKDKDKVIVQKDSELKALTVKVNELNETVQKLNNYSNMGSNHELEGYIGQEVSHGVQACHTPGVSTDNAAHEGESAHDVASLEAQILSSSSAALMAPTSGDGHWNQERKVDGSSQHDREVVSEQHDGEQAEAMAPTSAKDTNRIDELEDKLKIKDEKIAYLLENMQEMEERLTQLNTTDEGSTSISDEQVDVLRQEVESLKKSVEEKEFKFTKALATAKKIKLQLNQTSEALEKAKQEKASMQSELEEMTTKLISGSSDKSQEENPESTMKDLQIQLQTYSEFCEQLQEQVQTLTEKSHEHEKTVRQYDSTVEQQNQEKDGLEKSLLEKSEMMSVISRDNEELKTCLEEKERLNAELKSCLDEKEKMNSLLSEELDTTKASLRDIHGRASGAENVIQQKLEASQSELKSYKNRWNEINSQLNEKEDELEQHRQKLQELEEQNTGYMETVQIFQNERKTHIEQIQSLTQQLDTAIIEKENALKSESDHIDLQNKLSSVSDENVKLTKEKDYLTENNNLLEADLISFREQLTKKDEDISSLSESMNDMRMKLDNDEGDKQILAEKLVELTNANESLKDLTRNLKEKEDKITALTEKLTSVNDELVEMRSNSEKQLSELQHVNQSCENQTHEIQSHIEIIQQKDEQVLELNQQLEQLNEFFKTKEQLADKFNTEIQAHKEDSQLKDSQIKEQNNQIDTLHTCILETTQSVKNMETNMEQKENELRKNNELVASLNESLTVVKNENVELKSKVHDLNVMEASQNDNVHALEEIVTKKDEEIECLKEEIKTFKKVQQTKALSEEGEHEAMSSEIQRLQSNIAELQAKNEIVVSENNSTHRTLEELQTKFDSLHLGYQKLSEELTGVTGENESLKSDQEKQKGENESLKSGIEKQKEQLESQAETSKKLETLTEKIASLMADNEILNAEVHKQSALNLDLSQQFQEATLKMTTAEETICKINEDNEKMLKEYESLNQRLEAVTKENAELLAIIGKLNSDKPELESSDNRSSQSELLHSSQVKLTVEETGVVSETLVPVTEELIQCESEQFSHAAVSTAVDDTPLRDELEQLKTRLNHLTDENRTTEEKYQQQSAKFEKLLSKLKTFKDKNVTICQENAALKQQLSTAERMGDANVSQLEHKCSTLQEQLDLMEGKLREETLTAQKQMAESKALENELRLKNTDLEEMQTKLNQITEHNNDLKSELKSLQQEYESKNSNMSSRQVEVQNKNIALLEEIDELKSSLTGAQKDLKNMDDQKLATEKSEAKLISELSTEKLKYEEGCNELLAVKDQLKETELRVSEIRNKEEMAVRQLQDMKDQYNMLEQDNQNYQDIIERTSAANTQLKSALIKQKMHIEKIESESGTVAESNEKMKAIEKELADANTEKQYLEEEMDGLGGDLIQAKKEKSEALEVKQTALNELQILKEKLDSHKNKIDSLEWKLDEMNGIEDELESTRKLNDNLEKGQKEMTNEILKLETGMQSLSEEIKEKNANIEHLRADILQGKDEVEELNVRIQELTEMNSSLQEVNNELQGKIGAFETLQHQLEDKSEAADKTMLNMESSLKHASTQHEQAKEEIKVMKKQAEKSRKQLEKFDMLREEYVSLNDECNKIMSDNSALAKQVEELHTKLRENSKVTQYPTDAERTHSEKEKKTLTERVKQLEGECSNLRDFVADLTEKKSELSHTIQQLQFEKDSLQAKIGTVNIGNNDASLHGDYDRLQRQFRDTMVQKQQLRSDYDMSKRSLAQREARCQQLAMQVSQLAEDRSYLNTQLGSLSKSLREKEQELPKLQQEYRALFQSQVALKAKMAEMEKKAVMDYMQKSPAPSSGSITPVEGHVLPHRSSELKKRLEATELEQKKLRESNAELHRVYTTELERANELEKVLEITLNDRLGEQELLELEGLDSKEFSKIKGISLTRQENSSYLTRLQRWMSLQSAVPPANAGLDVQK